MDNLISTEDIIYAYTMGYFPMAEPEDGVIYWHSPDPRAIFPIDKLKPPRSLRQQIRKKRYECVIDMDFEAVIRSCANREDTWISEEMINLYIDLHRIGVAHSVETYQDGHLVGGLYGISLGAAFFGESMFSLLANSSKAAFFHLVNHLNRRGFILLDSQYINPHTKSLGAIEIPKKLYMIILEKALNMADSF